MSLELQRMIRDQANETRSQLHDMVSWEAEIQKRDDQLIELAKQGKFGYAPPDTSRLQATTTTSTKAKKVQIQTTDSNSKPESTEKPAEQKKNATSKAPKSYEEWQKIDGKYKDFDENEADPKESAAEHKEKGNNFYKKKQYSSAIKEYSQAIRLDPSNAIYFNNRAAAHYQLSNYVESEKDATKALSLDGRYVKAYIRRGNARRVQGKLQAALEDFQVANEIEPGTPEIETQLSKIREQLGISANGLITEVPEPKVKIIEDDEEPAKPVKPKIEVVEEEVPRKRPKVEVIEEKSFSPQAEETRNQKEAKIEIVEEKSFAPEPKKHPKVEVIEEKSFSPEAEQKSSKINIVSEETPAPAPSKIKIVSEEEETKPAAQQPTTSQPSSKVKIVVEEEEKPTSSKVKIVSEEPKPTASKVKIVAEEPKPETKPEPKPEPTKKTEEEPKIPKKQPRPDNTIISHAELDEKPKPKPKPKTQASPEKKPTRVRQIKPFIDMSAEEVPERLKQLTPETINQAIGGDVSAEIILKILKGLQGFDPNLAFEFIEQIGTHKLLRIALIGKAGLLIKPLVIEFIDNAKDIDGVRKANVRKSWKID